MGLTHVLLDIDGTLFPSAEFARKARVAALAAMKKEGMRASVRKAYSTLLRVIERTGPNHSNHFGNMMRSLGEKQDARIIAAGIRAYHAVKGSIRPFPESGRALGLMRRNELGTYIASEGRAVKQWDKVLRMGLQENFRGAFISEELGVGHAGVNVSGKSRRHNDGRETAHRT